MELEPVDTILITKVTHYYDTSIQIEGVHYTGYVIETTRGDIKMLIEASQICCEDFDVGVIYAPPREEGQDRHGDESLDTLKRLEGMYIAGVKLNREKMTSEVLEGKGVHTGEEANGESIRIYLLEHNWEAERKRSYDFMMTGPHEGYSTYGDCETDMTMFAYNCHNGYYSHSFILKFPPIGGGKAVEIISSL